MLQIALTEALAWGLISAAAAYPMLRWLAAGHPAAVVGACLAAVATKSALL